MENQRKSELEGEEREWSLELARGVVGSDGLIASRRPCWPRRIDGELAEPSGGPRHGCDEEDTAREAGRGAGSRRGGGPG